MSTYQVDVLIQGFPGRSVCHGGLGWSSVSLIRGQGRTILLDVGAFGMRKPLEKSLKSHGLSALDITDVILTHAHYDHAVNFVLFPNATVWIGQVEIDWAAAQKPGFNPLPELYVKELSSSAKVKKVQHQEEFIPGITAFEVPGHTPGHLLFVLDNGDTNILFTGDSAKNKAELICRKVIDTEDPAESAASIELIWEKWLEKPGSLLIPGHDVTMVLDENQHPVHVGTRTAGIYAWFTENIEHSDVFDLSKLPA
jgi:glyoxylase-like metal-dependent hydrolase (beta-lactamase superfamily II)